MKLIKIYPKKKYQLSYRITDPYKYCLSKKFTHFYATL